jgi:hypothetical protein
VALASDRETCAAMGAAGRAGIAPHHDYDRLARDYLDVIARVVAGAGKERKEHTQ